MMRAIAQTATEAVKAALMAAREAENPVNTARLVQVMSRTCGP